MHAKIDGVRKRIQGYLPVLPVDDSMGEGILSEGIVNGAKAVKKTVSQIRLFSIIPKGSFGGILETSGKILSSIICAAWPKDLRTGPS